MVLKEHVVNVHHLRCVARLVEGVIVEGLHGLNDAGQVNERAEVQLVVNGESVASFVLVEERQAEVLHFFTRWTSVFCWLFFYCRMQNSRDICVCPEDETYV